MARITWLFPSSSPNDIYADSWSQDTVAFRRSLIAWNGKPYYLSPYDLQDTFGQVISAIESGELKPFQDGTLSYDEIMDMVDEIENKERSEGNT